MYCIIVGALFLTSLCVVALNVTKRCHISFFFFCSLRNACTRTLCLVASYKQGTTRNTHTNTLTERRCCQYGSFPLLVFQCLSCTVEACLPLHIQSTIRALFVHNSHTFHWLREKWLLHTHTHTHHTIVYFPIMYLLNYTLIMTHPRPYYPSGMKDKRSINQSIMRTAPISTADIKHMYHHHQHHQPYDTTVD